VYAGLLPSIFRFELLSFSLLPLASSSCCLLASSCFTSLFHCVLRSAFQCGSLAFFLLHLSLSLSLILTFFCYLRSSFSLHSCISCYLRLPLSLPVFLSLRSCSEAALSLPPTFPAASLSFSMKCSITKKVACFFRFFFQSSSHFPIFSMAGRGFGVLGSVLSIKARYELMFYHKESCFLCYCFFLDLSHISPFSPMTGTGIGVLGSVLSLKAR
jgi:hypothetical protein